MRRPRGEPQAADRRRPASRAAASARRSPPRCRRGSQADRSCDTSGHHLAYAGRKCPPRHFTGPGHANQRRGRRWRTAHAPRSDRRRSWDEGLRGGERDAGEGGVAARVDPMPRGVRVRVMEDVERAVAVRTSTTNASPVLVSATATATRLSGSLHSSRTWIPSFGGGRARASNGGCRRSWRLARVAARRCDVARVLDALDGLGVLRARAVAAHQEGEPDQVALRGVRRDRHAPQDRATAGSRPRGGPHS